MRLIAVSALAAVLMGPAAVASAQSTGDRADARCLLVMQLVARDPKQQAAAVQGTFYYLGKLTAHGLSGKMEALLGAEGKTINSTAMVQSELTRCGGELNARNTELRGVFANLAQATTAARAAQRPAGATPPTK